MYNIIYLLNAITLILTRASYRILGQGIVETDNIAIYRTVYILVLMVRLSLVLSYATLLLIPAALVYSHPISMLGHLHVRRAPGEDQAHSEVSTSTSNPCIFRRVLYNASSGVYIAAYRCRPLPTNSVAMHT